MFAGAKSAVSDGEMSLVWTGTAEARSPVWTVAAGAWSPAWTWTGLKFLSPSSRLPVDLFLSALIDSS